MKTSFFMAAMLLASTAVLSAQQLDNPVTVPVTFYGEGILSGDPNGGYFSFGAVLPGGDAASATAQAPGGTAFYSGVHTANLEPGKDYTVTMTSTGCAVAWAHFQISNGEIYLGPGPQIGRQNAITLGTNYNFILRVELINDVTQGLAGKRGGECSSFPEDKPIWYVGLGSLRNGRSAGAVGFRRDSITSDLFTTSALVYDAIDPSEVTVTRDGSGHLTQVQSGAVVLTITTLSGTSYKIVASLPETPTTAFITYTVSQYTGSGGGIRIDKLESGITRSTVLQQGSSSWTLYDWRTATAGQAINTSNAVTTAITSSTGGTTADVSYGAGTGQMVKRKVFQGGELSSLVWGLGVTSAPTNTYAYYTSLSGTGWTGKVQSVVEPTGNWTSYDYFNDTTSLSAGQIQHIYRPWLDAPATPATATATNCYYETYDYVPNSDQTDVVPSLHTVAINGTAAGKTTWAYVWNYTTANNHTIGQTTRQDYGSASSFLTTTTLMYLENDPNTFFRGRLHAVIRPDGTKDAYAYYNGTWNASTNVFAANSGAGARQILVFHGQNAATLGSGGSPAGTAVSTWASGSLSWSLDTVYLVPNLSTVSEIIIDVHGRIVRDTEYIFVNATTIEPIAQTAHTFNANSLLQKDKDLIRSISTSEVAVNYAYSAGLLASKTEIDGTQTTWTYDAWLRNDTITNADGATVAGYPERTQTFTYYSSGLKQTAQECSCSPATTTYSYDTAGRRTSVAEPRPGSSTPLTTGYAYPSKVQTTLTLPTGATQTTDLYLDGKTKDVTGSGVVDNHCDYALESGGTGNIVKTTKHGTTTANGWLGVKTDWLGRTLTERSPEVGWISGSTKAVRKTSTYSGTTGQLTSSSLTDENASLVRLLPTHYYGYGNLGRLIQEGDDVDGTGNLTDSSTDRITKYSATFWKDTSGYNGWLRDDVTTVLRTAGVGNQTASTTRRTRFTRFNNGALLGSARVVSDVVTIDASLRSDSTLEYVNPTAHTRTRSYDIDGPSAVATTVWQDGYLKSETSISGVTKTYTYESQGLLDSLTEGTTGTATTYDYFPGTKYLATVSQTTGTSTFATTTYTYSWNTSAKSTTVTATIGGTNANTEYNALGLPWHTWGDAAQPTLISYDTFGRKTGLTTWQNPPAGTFTGPTWPSTPPTGNAISWTIDPATGISTRKTYPGGSHVDFTYNARGQVATRAWARTPTVTTTYNYYDSGVAPFTGELKQVSYSGGATTPTVSYTYNRIGAIASVTDAAGTRSFDYRDDLKLETEGLGTFYGSKTLSSTYDTYGRPTGWGYGSAPDASATIGFDGTTGRVNSVNGTLGAASTTFTIGYAAGTDCVSSVTNGSYNRSTTLSSKYDVIASATTTLGSTTLGSFSAQYNNALDPHGWRTGQGIAASSYATALGFGSAVTATFGYDGYGQLTNATSTLSGRGLSWTYDLAGNRLTETNTATTNYTADALNRYSAITGQRQEPGIAYDADGNLTQDATWTYSYDAENRLISMTKSGQSLTFAYDYLGRRIRKTVTGTGAYDVKFLWFGWKLAAELAVNGTTVNKTFVWGPDFSNAQGNAGGAGGLLAQIDTTNGVSYAIADTFGTIVAYTNTSGTIVAAVEYSPYGKGLSAAGAWTSYPIGFASQYMDWEPGLVYYGRRYYAPKHGRFINRDPIEEAGGNNLYHFVGNNPVSRWDVLGLKRGLYRRWGTDFVRVRFEPGVRDRDVAGQGIDLHAIAEADAQAKFRAFGDNAAEGTLGGEAERLRSAQSAQEIRDGKVKIVGIGTQYGKVTEIEVETSDGERRVIDVSAQDVTMADLRASNSTTTFRVTTTIRPPDFEAGQKSSQTITIDNGSGLILNQSSATGTTNIVYLGDVPARSFDINPLTGLVTPMTGFNASVVPVATATGLVLKINMNGEAGSMAFPANINYNLNITLNPTLGTTTLNGGHDPYPSYSVFQNDVLISDFQQSNSLWKFSPFLLIGTGNEPFPPVGP